MSYEPRRPEFELPPRPSNDRAFCLGLLIGSVMGVMTTTFTLVSAINWNAFCKSIF